MRIVLTVFLAVFSTWAAAEDLFEGAPAAPEGYADYKAAQAAVLKGDVTIANNNPKVPENIRFTEDIEYATPDGISLKLDLYVPTDAKTPPPVLLMIHGGGWSKGNKDDARPYTVPFAAMGYAAATMQYRLTPEHKFPKAIQDVNSAIEWLRTHGEEYGFDGTRIALSGGSAGGHLALLAGYGQDPALGCPENPEGVKDRVEAIINLYGVVDCTTPIAQKAHQVRNFIGAPYAESVDMHALASPIFHLDEDDPVTLTFHGTIDELVPIDQGDRLHAKLDELGITNYYDRIDGWPHSMDVAEPIHARCVYVVGKFLEKHLPLEK